MPPAAGEEEMFSGRFNFSRKNRGMDWRLLHGVDLSRVVQRQDLAALERGISAVMQGNIDFDDAVHLSPNNYVQLIRLCQLAIDFLEHEVAWLRNMVITLREKHAVLERYGNALQDLGSCLEAETEAVERASSSSSQPPGSHSVQRRSRLSAARAVQVLKEQLASVLQQHEGQWALSVQEAKQSYASFHFLNTATPINWRALHSVNVNTLISTGQISELVSLEEMVAYGDIMGEDLQSLTEANFKQLAQLSQCIVEVLCFWRLKFSGQRESYDAQCESALHAVLNGYSACKQKERQLKDAHRSIRRQQDNQLPHEGVSPGPASPYTPGAGSPPVVAIQGAVASPAVRGAMGAVYLADGVTVAVSPETAEVQRKLTNMQIKMRAETTHQDNLRDKLEDLQRAVERMKLRNLYRILEEQRIREEEQDFARSQVHDKIMEVKARAMQEHLAEKPQKLYTVSGRKGPLDSQFLTPKTTPRKSMTDFRGSTS